MNHTARSFPLSQGAYPVAEDLKGALLLRLLDEEVTHKALVFTRTRYRANRLAEWLRRHDVSCERVHGSRSPRQRAAAVDGFNGGTIRVLVATDIAAFNGEVETPFSILNFDVPNAPDDYLQRLEHAVSGDEHGAAFTLVADGEEGRLRAIEKVLGEPLERREVEDLDLGEEPAERFSIPEGERVARMRSRKGEGRSRGEPKREKTPPKTAAELEEEEEARLRRIAEEQQAQAVAARSRPQPWIIQPEEWQQRPSTSGQQSRRSRRSRAGSKRKSSRGR